MKMIKLALSFVLLFVCTISSAYAANEATITGTTKLNSTYNSNVTDTLSFEVTWTDTSIEITKNESYGLMWDPSTLSYIKNPDDITENYYISNGLVSASVTNKSLQDIVVKPVVSELSLTDTFIIGTYASDPIKGVKVDGNPEVGKTGETSEPGIVDITFRESGRANALKDAYEALQENDTVAKITISIYPEY